MRFWNRLWKRSLHLKEILTDASKIMVLKGHHVHLVRGEVYNIKITYPYDVTVAKALLGLEEMPDA